MLGLDAKGGLLSSKRYCLAPTEAEFWPPRTPPHAGGAGRPSLRVPQAGAAQRRAAGGARGSGLVPGLLRPRGPRPLEAAELPALDAVREALEEALGSSSREKRASTSSVPLSSRPSSTACSPPGSCGVTSTSPGRSAPASTGSTAAWTLRVPVVQALFDQIATPNLLGTLGLVPVLDLAAAALNRVDQTSILQPDSKQHHAVQYFYEPFLEAFDPELRKELGVWYTPPEIVEYMVARVDTVLREELDVPDGLADPRVYVLDPCCGTGAYLVEVLERIAQTLDEKGGDALSAGEVKKAAMERVFGFEILPAPFVIAHMQLGLLLQNMHLPLADQERVGVFLTNALTGWESPHGHQQVLALPELEAERDAAEQVKQELPILVVLGNPPYNGYAGMATAEERGLTDGLPDDQEGAGAPGPGSQRPLRALLPHGRDAASWRRPAGGSSASSPTTPGWTACRSPGCASAIWRCSTRSGSTV